MEKRIFTSFRALFSGLMVLAAATAWASPGDVLLEETFDTQEAFDS